MRKALRALLTGAIDYAGLFPPAQLPLEQTLANFKKYRRCADRWMLGRLVIPVAKLDQVEPLDSLCLIGSEDLEADMQRINAYCARSSMTVSLSYERKIDEANSIRNIAKQLDQSNVPVKEIYFERPNAPTEAIEVIREVANDSDLVVGFKLRCGGVKAEDFPSTSDVADVLSQCRGLPLKLTAGLHHPIWRWDDPIGVNMLGFINVMAAGVLHQRLNLSVDRIADILEDSNSDSFRFEDDGLSWREHRIDTVEIEESRDLFPGFGSCSFVEPRDDLHELGWM